jgi:hypothetical protein
MNRAGEARSRVAWKIRELRQNQRILQAAHDLAVRLHGMEHLHWHKSLLDIYAADRLESDLRRHRELINEWRLVGKEYRK